VNPVVSIVLVTYNSGRVLSDCLDSLTGAGAEVIVVDNASADSTVEIAKRTADIVVANLKNMASPRPRIKA